MCLRSLHVTALSFALSHLVHAPCCLCPTAIEKRRTSSRGWISSDTIFLLFIVDSLDIGLDLFFYLPQCQLFLSSWGPILHSQQLFLPSIYTYTHIYIYIPICIHTYIHTYIYTHLYTHTYIYSYLRRHLPSGLAGCQVHQLKPDTDVGCGLLNAI